jgi:hypothetical protein
MGDCSARNRPPHYAELAAQGIDSRFVLSIVSGTLVYLSHKGLDASVLDATKPNQELFPLLQLLALVW